MSTDGSFDNEDREMMRQRLASYSGRERITLLRFIGTLLMHPVMREERILQLMMDALDGRPVRRKDRHLRVVAEVEDE